MEIVNAEILSKILGGAYPEAFDLGGGRVRRHWIVRTVAPVALDLSIEGLSDRLQTTAQETIRTEHHLDLDAIRSYLPTVTIFKITERHLVVRTDFSPKKLPSDASAVGQWGVLRQLHALVPLEEVQGYPTDAWFLMR